MSRFDELVIELKQELEKMSQLYLDVHKLEGDVKIEQSKIVEQNLTIKHRIEELIASQKAIDDKQIQLDQREKIIIAKEKQNILLDNKLKELQDRTAEVLVQEKKLKLRQEQYEKDKVILDKQTEIYKKLDETDAMRKTRLKLKEDELDREIARVKNMGI